MTKLIIVGSGGFGREIAWIVRRAEKAGISLQIEGFCDDDSFRASEVEKIAPFLGTIQDVEKRASKGGYICAIGNNKIRREIMLRLNSAGFEPVSVVDPTAVIADDAAVGAGCFIGVHAAVSTGSKVGGGVIINHNVSVGHDAEIGDYAQLCPGVSLSGGCVVGEGALLGSNSCALPGRSMGCWSVLGAGSLLLSDLGEEESRVRMR